eukprot:CAMPEP_0175861416 /NCGR_PEP_ID=MMETSP0107_2-20121207/31368_1 /TAXON_ID=195067 ORGANISM="Goniomonas pacifica, Strain CCMP1869" /NCGR_SAMPLE_ID=MMETSP0107_2 /ASSEMBLY_ACC=CAM_ASM_000203 /LENGTH=96 /DNA_ID=CAMNT_0017178283 /DNA_START=18 /DNA_END=308 /DNA_ORIENTATION=+
MQLHDAVQCGDVERVRAFLNSGADANVYDTTGRTALIAAVQQRHVEVVRTLLSYAHVDRRLLDNNGSGHPARYYAKRNSKMLSLFNAKPTKPAGSG